MNAWASWLVPLLAAGLVCEAQGQEAAAVRFEVIPGAGADAEVIAPLEDARQALGRVPSTLEDVQAWSDRFSATLRQRGFPLGQVLMTQADWARSRQGGEAVFSVFPGRISRITVQNGSRVDDDRLRRRITHALCGASTLADDSRCFLQTARFERTTQLLQDLPGVTLNGSPHFAPGAGQGDVEVAFDLAQRGEPFQADLVFDNKGIESTGAYRLGVTALGNNHFGLGESYALTVMATEKHMWTGYLNGSLPLFDSGWRATAGVTRQQYSLNAGTAVTGVATTYGAGVVYPLQRGLDRNLWAGVSLNRTDAAVSYDAFEFSTHSTLDSVRFTLQADNGDRPQQLRTDLWSANATLSLGQQRNDDDLDSGPRRAGHYAKLSAGGFGRLALTGDGNTFLAGRFNGQLASRNLDPSERLAVGGAEAVRAYRNDEGSFDDGAILSAGLYRRLPVAAGHQLQLGAFVDYARGRVNHSPWADWEASYVGIPGVRNLRTLAGYGLGVDWLTPFGATLSLAAARPFGFSSGSWVEPGKRPTQYWMSFTWSH